MIQRVIKKLRYRHEVGYSWFGRRVSVVSLVICALVVSSCSASSAPIAGTVPGGEVMLVPQVSAGWAGWCITVVTKGSGGCGGEPGKSGSILSETWSSRSGGSSGRATRYVTKGAALTTGEVVEVSVDGGRPVPTRPASAVAGDLGLRYVVVEIRGQKQEKEDNKSFPYFTPLDSQGRVIRRVLKPVVSLGFMVPTREWKQPEGVPSGVCELGTEGWPGVSARWGAVVTEVKRSYSGLPDQPFLSCASTEYFYEEQSVEAGVLLDALHPGAEPPPLPGLKAVLGHPGVFQAQGESGEGQMLARRIPKAWLVVEEGGSSFEERLALLDHLRATVDI